MKKRRLVSSDLEELIITSEDARALEVVNEIIDARNMRDYNAVIASFNPAECDPEAGREWNALAAAYSGSFAALADLLVAKQGQLQPNALELIRDRLTGKYKAPRGGARHRQPRLAVGENVAVVASEVPMIERILRDEFPQRFPKGRGYREWAIKIAALAYDFNYSKLRNRVGRGKKLRRMPRVLSRA
jgi:hypothetical protein